MKQILLSVATVLLLASCSTNKNFLRKRNEDKALQDAVKALDKKPSNSDASHAIPVLYNSIQQKNLAAINSLAGSDDLSRWEKLAHAYGNMQNAFWAITGSQNASRLIAPADYTFQLNLTRQQAAEAYYQKGLEYIGYPGKNNAATAYGHFKKANEWSDNYRDTKSRMEQAYENSIVNVQVNPISINNFYYNTGWNNRGNYFADENFQHNLVRDLGGPYANRYPARFYTEIEARMSNQQMDWVVELVFRDLDIPRPTETREDRNAIRQIEVGRDTLNRPVYRSVSATIHIIRRSLTARAKMDINTMDMNTHRSVGYNSISEDYCWQTEEATFSGDSRALGENDWRMINNRNYEPTQEEIINQLYARIFPRVKNEIASRVGW